MLSKVIFSYSVIRPLLFFLFIHVYDVLIIDTYCLIVHLKLYSLNRVIVACLRLLV